MATSLEDFMGCQHCAIHFTLLAVVPNYSCMPHTFKHILLNKMCPPRIDHIGLKRGSGRSVVVETLHKLLVKQKNKAIVRQLTDTPPYISKEGV